MRRWVNILRFVFHFGLSQRRGQTKLNFETTQYFLTGGSYFPDADPRPFCCSTSINLGHRTFTLNTNLYKKLAYSGSVGLAGVRWLPFLSAVRSVVLTGTEQYPPCLSSWLWRDRHSLQKDFSLLISDSSTNYGFLTWTSARIKQW